MTKKKGIVAAIVLAITLGVAFITFVILWGMNDFRIVWNVTEGQTIHWEYGCGGPDQPIEAVFKGNIFCKKGKVVGPMCDIAVDTEKIGTQKVTYHAKEGMYSSDVSVFIEVSDTVEPEIELVTNPDAFTSPIATYEEEGYKAIDNYDGDITEKVVREEKDGKVYYTVSDSFGNETTVIREIVYKDVVLPVIELKKGDKVTANIGDEYKEPGFVASDDCDGDITDLVTVTGAVDTKVPGDYTLSYTVKDSYNNETTVTRVVTVKDVAPPVLNMEGASVVYLEKGKTYTEQGCTAKDNVDGVVNVTTSGSVNADKCGTYKVKYTATDKSGNTATATRTIYVFQKPKDADKVNPGKKVIYLTFDDGPGRYTQKLLDVLDKYNVKVTFFVTNQFPDYKDMIKKEYDAGHTVAVHTYTHEYRQVYKNAESYMADFEKMNELIKKQTGEYAWLTRFPGGSSTTYIRKLKPYTDALDKVGVEYCDWNVTSGDANGNIGKDAVVKNVIKGVKGHDVSVVLQHDIHSFSVNAVEEIIVWGLSNGYTFLPLEPSSPMVHHKR